MPPLITLLTDFGTADGYVGEMKGVILAALAGAASGAGTGAGTGAQLVDISHDIPPQDVESARLALARYWRRFPPRTVHLVVVDPGVGSSRAAIAVESDGRFLVGPDNGVLSPALLMTRARAVALPIPAHAAATFHGRDVFAPAAAELARGAPLTALGEPHDDPVVRRTPEAKRLADGAVAGTIIAVDRFGNLITNLIAPRGGSVEIAGRVVPIVRAYADVAPGALAALVGSSGLVEVAARDDSAARVLSATRGAPVVLRPPRA